MEQKTKMPLWAKWTVFGLVVFIAILLCIITHQDAKSKLDKANTEKKKITREKDSLVSKRDDVIDSGKEQSQTDADEGNEIIKTIDNEKINHVNDTTYNAMCEYITNFKPSDAK